MVQWSLGLHISPRVSAGHISLEAGKIVAHGASSSLDVLSREEDSGITQAYLDGLNVIQQER